MVTAIMKLRRTLRGRKAMANLDKYSKSRGITLLTKVHVVKAMAFPVVMYRHESCTIKKAEYNLMLLNHGDVHRRLLRVPWTAWRSKQSILKEINPEYSLEGLTLKFQYFGHLMKRSDSLEKTLSLYRHKANGEGGNRG